MKNESSQTYGLYTPQLESDACGIGMIVHLNRNTDHQIINNALTMLENMEHRGAVGVEKNSGDGAGILCDIPHDFFLQYAKSTNNTLPNKGEYGVGFVFLPKEIQQRIECVKIIAQSAKDYNIHIAFNRDVPINKDIIGASSFSTEPFMQQFFSVPSNKPESHVIFEKQLYILRNKITREVVKKYPELREVFYFPSLSSKSIIYKGQLKASQLRKYYPDLSDPNFTSSKAIIHSRFSTNTIPKWKLAQPFRSIAHNGEINTIQSNLNSWKARENKLLMLRDTAE